VCERNKDFIFIVCERNEAEERKKEKQKVDKRFLTAPGTM
jgi:hypothetical protein